MKLDEGHGENKYPSVSWLPHIMFSMNCERHEGIKDLPYCVLFGRYPPVGIAVVHGDITLLLFFSKLSKKQGVATIELILKERTVVPARSEMELMVRNAGPITNGTWVVGNKTPTNQGVMVASAVVSPNFSFTIEKSTYLWCNSPIHTQHRIANGALYLYVRSRPIVYMHGVGVAGACRNEYI